MHGTSDTQPRLPVREASLRRIGGRWSTVTACLAEVRSCAATFEHRGHAWRGVTATVAELALRATASAVTR